MADDGVVVNTAWLRNALRYPAAGQDVKKDEAIDAAYAAIEEAGIVMESSLAGTPIDDLYRCLANAFEDAPLGERVVLKVQTVLRGAVDRARNATASASFTAPTHLARSNVRHLSVCC